VHADSSNVFDKLKSSPLHLPSHHPDIAVLKETHAVQVATNSFGQLSWDEAYKLEFKNSSMPGYVILFKEKSAESSLTFLALSNISSSKEDAGLVGRLAKKNETNSFVDWFLLDGRLLADAAMTVRNMHGISETSVEPTIDFSCIIPCMDGCLKENLVGNCADDCSACVVSIATGGGWFNANCFTCTICAGFSAIGCARDCARDCATYCSEQVKPY